MQHSKMFIISLFLALSAFVAATTAVDASVDTLVVKREALNARMHQRKAAGHGAFKKRQPSESELAGVERVRRAQYHPATRTATPVADIEIEKRQLNNIGNIGIGTGSGNTNVGVGTGSGLGCVVVGGIRVGLGCTTNNNNPQPSQAVCRGTNYDGCSPGANYGAAAGIGGSGAAAGVSQCCQSGFTCQKVGPFSQSICLNLPFAQLYNLNLAIDNRNFGTQQEFGDYLDYLRNGGTF